VHVRVEREIYGGESPLQQAPPRERGKQQENRRLHVIVGAIEPSDAVAFQISLSCRSSEALDAGDRRMRLLLGLEQQRIALRVKALARLVLIVAPRIPLSELLLDIGLVLSSLRLISASRSACAALSAPIRWAVLSALTALNTACTITPTSAITATTIATAGGTVSSAAIRVTLRSLVQLGRAAVDVAAAAAPPGR
jgi:hypothetical protein